MPKFVPRQRKHKVLARQKAAGDGPQSAVSSHDTNTTMIIPLSRNDREMKRQKLREDLRAQQPKMSAKKQKRLDKYIDNKLKKDENLALVRQLEKEKNKWDLRGLMSSKNLKKRDFSDFVNGQVGNGLQDHEIVNVNSDAMQDRLDKTRDEQDDDTVSEDSFEANHQEAFDERAVPDSDEMWTAQRAPPVQGIGLAQPLQFGPDGLPIIKKRTSKREKHKSSVQDIDPRLEEVEVCEELPWEGFDSERGEGESPSQTDSSDNDEINSISQQDSEEETGESEETDGDDGIVSDSSTSIMSKENTKIKPRASAFKSWAMQQLNQAIDHTPSYAADGKGELPTHQRHETKRTLDETVAKPAVELVNGLPAVETSSIDRRVYTVQVQRTESIQELRSQLPVLQREQEIMEAIHTNAVVIIKGDTGSGKTTQIPQLLYESGYGDPNSLTPGMIGVTQPRRVAAVSMAKRVSEELGEHGCRVAHQVRFDSSASANTAIKFMTDGILLRELSEDLLLRKYSAIIIDEAHERSVNTDLLIGVLSKIVPARVKKDKLNPNPQPLKVIIMSATLNVGDFLHSKLFDPQLKPPVIEVEGRQHRVVTHFTLRSRADYLEETIEKVKRAHRKLPRGGILVFLTGQSEIKQVQARLKRELGRSTNYMSIEPTPSRMRVAASETPLEVEDIDFGIGQDMGADEEVEIDILTPSDDEAQDREFEISDDDQENEEGKERSDTNSLMPRPDKRDVYDSVHILPLYSQLPTKEQLRVFDPPPDRSRLIVLATNVAETSLTIPGIRYVFDCGRSKKRNYHLDTGVQRFEIDYISKASAQQRAGRAGRTGPGHCWRLYTSAVYERFFAEHTEPEILRAPAENVVLQIKAFAFPRPVVEFPFPTSPSSQTLDQAERLLNNLGALTPGGEVTDLGRELSVYPLSPRLSKILASAVRAKGILSPAIALVAALTVGDIYIDEQTAPIQSDAERDDHHDRDDYEQNQQKQKYGRARATLSQHDSTSDAMRLVTAVSMYANATDQDEYCKQFSLKSKAMKEISQLVQQLRVIVTANHPEAHDVSSLNFTKSKMPSSLLRSISRVAASGYTDQIAIRWDCLPNPPTLFSKPRRSIDVPYFSLVSMGVSVASSAISDSQLRQTAVFIHPSSVLSRQSPKSLPQYIIYTHLQQSQVRTIGSESVPITRMFPLTPIDTATLSQLARDTALIEYGKPVSGMSIEFVPGLPKRRVCWVSRELKYHHGTGVRGFGWPLPVVKVKQIMDVKTRSGWRVEEVLS